MTSPGGDKNGSGTPPPQMNTEPFTRTDPFLDAEAGHVEDSSDSVGSTTSNKSEDDRKTPDAEGNIASKDFGNTDSHSPRSDSDDEGVIEKAKTVADEAAHGDIAEKIKTAASDLFHVDSLHATGPGGWFRPTTVRARIKWKDDVTGGEPDEKGGYPAPRPDLNLLWRSRDNRKGRNSIVRPVDPFAERFSWKQPFNLLPKFLEKLKEIGKNSLNLLTVYAYWDMAWWSGWTYTIGSMLFVVDGILAWTEVAYPWTEFENEESYAIPLCFLIGAILYQIGAVAGYLEAVNDGSFHGSAMRKLLEGHEATSKSLLDDKIRNFFGTIAHPHQHRDEARADALANAVDPEAGWRTKDTDERPGSIYPTGKEPAPRRGSVDMGEAEEGETTLYSTWRWWPTWHALWTHHIRDIAWVAVTIQLFGVTLYGVTAITIFPSIIDPLTDNQELGAYWIPQVVAAACFLIASILFMLETQAKWYKIEPTVLGWWIAFWAIIGSVGFECIAIFGIIAQHHEWAEYHSDLATVWGSTAYLIGSLLQWYEAVNKRPLDEILKEPGEKASYQIHPI